LSCRCTRSVTEALPVHYAKVSRMLVLELHRHHTSIARQDEFNDERMMPISLWTLSIILFSNNLVSRHTRTSTVRGRRGRRRINSTAHTLAALFKSHVFRIDQMKPC
jgi:hypothetical protein